MASDTPSPSVRNHNTQGDRKNVFYGWWIVIAGSTSQAYTSGTFWQGFGAFFDPIVEHFGWSRALTAGAVSLQRTESGAISPFVGWFIDKFGPRNVMLSGIFATGLGFILLARINELWQFYLAFTLITVGLSFGTFLVVTTTVANWFVTKRAKAIAIMSAGSGLGGFLVPALVWLIMVTDWRTALMLVGIGFWVTGIPAALVMRSRPEDYNMLPDGENQQRNFGNLSKDEANKTGKPITDTAVGHIEPNFTAREAMGTRAFWQLALAMGGGQLIMSATVHQIPALSSFGVSRGTAGLVILAISIVGLFGRLGSGIIGDKLDKRHVIAFAFLLQFTGTVTFAYTSTNWHLVGFVVLWGLGFGASIPVRFAMLADYFGRRHFGTIMGVMMTFSTVFGVFGPIYVGWMFDVRGNYREPFLVLAASILFSIPLILTLSQPQQPNSQSITE